MLAYRRYATGKYSDTGIAHLLTEQGYRSKIGRRFSKETIRDLLQNRTYLGYVKYQAYRRNADGSRSHKAPEQERLFQLMLARVWVVEDKVVRMCLRPNFHVTVGLDAKRPTEFSVDLDSYQNGSDGYHSLSGKFQVAFIPPYSLLESKQLWPAYHTNEPTSGISVTRSA